MNIEKHCFNLGALLGHFQSLEFLLRSYLHNQSPEDNLNSNEPNYYSLNLGEELLENEFTNFDSLGRLIDKTNIHFKEKGIAEIDKSIVDIRDVLAHGRVSAEQANGELRLIKFSKPIEGKVKIVFNQIMTETWLIENRERVKKEIIKVHGNL